MELNKYEKIAKKYLVEDFKSAASPNTTLSNILNQLELEDKYFSNRAVEFLKQKKLLALHTYISNECTFIKYLSLAKIEQENRHKVIGVKPFKKHLQKDKLDKKAPVKMHEKSSPSKNIIKNKKNAVQEIMDNTEKKVRKNYIFIDYENVQPLSFDLPKDYPFKVILFVGANQTKIPIELATSMQELGSNGEYVRIGGSGKNALDFHITFYLGRLFEQDPFGYFHIISKDTGFDVVIKHLKDKNVLIQRYNQINDISAFKTSVSQSIDEKIQVIVDYLIKRGNAKPRKVETLSNTINSLFLRSLSKEELTVLVNKLAQKKLIRIEETKIHYLLK